MTDQEIVKHKKKLWRIENVDKLNEYAKGRCCKLSPYVYITNGNKKYRMRKAIKCEIAK